MMLKVYFGIYNIYQILCNKHLILSPQNATLAIIENILQPLKSYRMLWALTDSNRRPSACKADALNQLS